MNKNLILPLLAFCVCVATPPAQAETALTLSHAIVGERFDYTVQSGDFLISLAARFGEPAQLIAQNNHLDYNKRLHPRQRLEIDNRHAVPETLNDGILINLPQRMLFFFKDNALVGAYPVGLGMPTWPTPEGQFSAVELRRHPAWVVPVSIQAEMRKKGEPVLTKVPPGPDNPLGAYWIGLSIPGYGIHGTNAPSSVYHFQSHGCIRLQPQNIAKLFPQLRTGDSGKIIYAPAMLALLGDGSIYAEVDRDIYSKGIDALALFKQLAETNQLSQRIDWAKMAQVVEQQTGIATRIDLQTGAH